MNALSNELLDRCYSLDYVENIDVNEAVVVDIDFVVDDELINV